MSIETKSSKNLNDSLSHETNLMNNGCIHENTNDLSERLQYALDVSDEGKNGIDESSACDDDEASRSDDVRLGYGASPPRRDSKLTLAVDHPLMAANVAPSIYSSPRVDSSSDDEELKKPIRNNSKNNLYLSANGDNGRPDFLKINKNYLTSTPDRNTPPEFVDWNVSGVPKTTVSNTPKLTGSAALRSTNKRSVSASEIEERRTTSNRKSQSLGANLRTLVTEVQNSDRFKANGDNGGVESKMAAVKASSQLSDRLVSDALVLDRHMKDMKSDAQRRRIEVPSGFLDSSNDTVNSEVSTHEPLARIDLDEYMEGAWKWREAGPRFDIPMQLKATPAQRSPETSPASSPSQERSLRAVLDPYRGTVSLRRPPPQPGRKKAILQISDDDTDCDDVDELDSFDQPSSFNQKSPSFNEESPSSNRKTASPSRISPGFNQKSPSCNQKSPPYNQNTPTYNKKSPSFNHKSPSFAQKSPSLYTSDKSSESFLSPMNLVSSRNSSGHFLSPFNMSGSPQVRQHSRTPLRLPGSPRVQESFRSPNSDDDRSPPDASVYEDAENFDESESQWDGSIPEYSLQEEREDLRSWMKVSLHEGVSYTCDLRVVEPYKRVVSHGGYAPCGAAVILLSGCFFPPAAAPCYDHVMDNLFLYIIRTLQQLVTDEYVLVYLHAATDHERLPRVRWMRNCYTMIDKRLRKNLKTLYIVHPTLYIKTVVFVLKAIVSSKFMRKIVYAASLDELSRHVAVEPAAVADEVWRFERARQQVG